MSTFEEYAALARHLSELRRAGERDAAADTARRTAIRATADQLGHRLAAQEQRLRQLGRATAQPEPGLAPATVPAPGMAPPGDAGHRTAAEASYPRPHTGTALALPAAVPAPVPAPREPVDTDPAVAVEHARQAADAADAAAHAAEQLAQRPPLLPGWSPFARAAAVYAACALVTVVPTLVLELGNRVGTVGTFTLFAWMCAGLPVLALFAGYFVLGRWGTPPLGTGTVRRYLPLGVAVCFGTLPIVYCGYFLALRFLIG
ncbi:hypothetical protein AB0I61_04115 [Polymorphospora rubra]|uniref:hypothetical protein n=1 Tax=Polymorphospora rubra TaxID=338584 RepID=UPI0033D58BB2